MYVGLNDVLRFRTGERKARPRSSTPKEVARSAGACYRFDKTKLDLGQKD